ncbi:flagellar protein FlaG [Metabacillus sp. GX 13764]|uniref:flagellar protein FlaG n=1 Tax=Metabacillus kandeliae TaxID=2900151 RepID=UPI001E56582A|nr:flagellar protein FlaG [Metabacillus kandeliae]MCD7034442.1 flagellar protein FlaG [Metabacillus kandeliae]
MSINTISAQHVPHTQETENKTKQDHLIPVVQENAETQITKEQLEKAIHGMNDFVQSGNTHLQFKLHEKLDEYYVTVVDDQTNEVVKEIPSKRLLDTYAAMNDFIGLLMDKKI